MTDINDTLKTYKYNLKESNNALAVFVMIVGICAIIALFIYTGLRILNDVLML